MVLGFRQFGGLNPNVSVELITEAIGNTPRLAREKSLKLVNDDKVDIMVGVVGTHALRDIHEVFVGSKTPLIVNSVGEHVVTQAEHSDQTRYIVRYLLTLSGRQAYVQLAIECENREQSDVRYRLKGWTSPVKQGGGGPWDSVLWDKNPAASFCFEAPAQTVYPPSGPSCPRFSSLVPHKTDAVFSHHFPTVRLCPGSSSTQVHSLFQNVR